MARSPVTSTEVERVTLAGRAQNTDLVAVEEPLQIILGHGPAHRRRDVPLAVTMRTPGHDADLVTGFLFGEGVISGPNDLLALRRCPSSDTPDNVIRAVLHCDLPVPAHLLERTLTMTSACGVCGERTLEALRKTGCVPIAPRSGEFEPRAIRKALAAMEADSGFFRNTGGTHGAALFDATGERLAHREDVGRHNALDKLVGADLRTRVGDDSDESVFVVVSSRASFELVQKTVRAGFPMLVALGAASSLAIETAKRFGLTLVGFARERRFNVYAGSTRIAPEANAFDFVETEAG